MFVMYKKATSWKFILRRTKNVGNFILVFLVSLNAQINENVSIKGFILLVLHWYVLLHSSTHCIEMFILALEINDFLYFVPKYYSIFELLYLYSPSKTTSVARPPPWPIRSCPPPTALRSTTVRSQRTAHSVPPWGRLHQLRCHHRQGGWRAASSTATRAAACGESCASPSISRWIQLQFQ